MENLKILNKLAKIKQEIIVPKNQKNAYGGYSYRSNEDILTTFKPYEKKYDVIIIQNDEIKHINENLIIEATSTIIDVESGEEISTKASAIIDFDKSNKMDLSQRTGSASSYARKYSLSGLLSLDDQKDADSTNKHGKTSEIQTAPNIIIDEKKKILEIIEILSKRYDKKFIYDNIKSVYETNLTNEEIANKFMNKFVIKSLTKTSLKDFVKKVAEMNNIDTNNLSDEKQKNFILSIIEMAKNTAGEQESSKVFLSDEQCTLILSKTTL